MKIVTYFSGVFGLKVVHDTTKYRSIYNYLTVVFGHCVWSWAFLTVFTIEIEMKLQTRPRSLFIMRISKHQICKQLLKRISRIKTIFKSVNLF